MLLQKLYRRSGLRAVTLIRACALNAARRPVRRENLAPIRALLLFLLALVGGLGSARPAAAQSDPSQVGQWSPVSSMPYYAIHLHLLPTGKVLFWDRQSRQTLWDPETGSFTPAAQCPYNIFCTGHTLLADGRLFVAGGHVVDGVGLPHASIYDPFTDTWTPLPDMAAARWYPTVTTLANGQDVLVMSGQIDNTIGLNLTPEVWDSTAGAWRELTGATMPISMYSKMFLAPNGLIFNPSPIQVSRYFDVTGIGTVIKVGYSRINYRSNGSAVLYDDGKVLIVGGGDPPTATAEVIDLNAAAPVWQSTGSMSVPRMFQCATLLPDGTVLVTGGSSATAATAASAPTYPAELWNPATGNWTTLASNSAFRGYHSNAILLPDGRVLTTSGDYYPAASLTLPYQNANMQIFSPPYLFKGARPTITSVPLHVTYGQQVFVQTPDAASIAKVTLIRLSSSTHTNNMNQRINRLSFTLGDGGLNVTTPPNSVLCPPGHYMLFLVNSQGVPSVAKIVRVDIPPAPPSNLTAQVVVPHQINLSWIDHASNEDGFKIERSTDGVNFTQIDTVGPNVTSYTAAGLSGATQYYFRVCAYNGGDSDYSNIQSALTLPDPPNPPTGLAMTSRAQTTVALTWSDNSNNEDGFKIEGSTDGTHFTPAGSVGQNQTTCTVTGLSAATQYSFRVYAYNAGGNSGYSNVLSVTTLPNPPAAPTGLSATPTSKTTINLSWTDQAGNEDGFKIERSSDGVHFTQIGTVGPNITNYTATGLTKATQYSFRVRAYNIGGNSDYSSTANATTWPDPPAPPDNLNATTVSASQINLTWRDWAGNETGFVIERALGNGSFARVATVGVNVTSYSDTGLQANTRYRYRVYAYNAGGNSDYSNVDSAKTKKR
ncbi:MAG TPA: fibronectin type III domain-containing protein [Chthonomonadaceae bacterium]|nr:fibronectin type III domain-containing protein [Chthonomonadaceae bacterium]